MRLLLLFTLRSHRGIRVVISHASVLITLLLILLLLLLKLTRLQLLLLIMESLVLRYRRRRLLGRTDRRDRFSVRVHPVFRFSPRRERVAGRKGRRRRRF